LHEVKTARKYKAIKITCTTNTHRNRQRRRDGDYYTAYHVCV